MPHINLWEPCYFVKVPDGLQAYTLDVLWLQEEGAQIHVSVWAKASHSQRMWAKVSSSAPHLLHSGLSDIPVRWKVLCPVRMPVTALDVVLLKDRTLALASRQGPEISSQARLWVSPRPRKVRVKFTLEQAMNARRGISGKDLPFL